MSDDQHDRPAAEPQEGSAPGNQPHDVPAEKQNLSAPPVVEPQDHEATQRADDSRPSVAGSTAEDMPPLGEPTHPAGAAAAVPAGRPGAVTPPPPPAHPGVDMFGAVFGSDTSGFNRLVPRRTAELSSPRPYGEWFDEAVDALEEAWPGFGDNVLRVVVVRGELTLHVKPAAVLEIARVLRDDPNLRFELLSSVSGVDYPGSETRLHAVYHFTSLTYRRRLRVEAAVTLEDPHVPSVCSVYPTADFHERETWDMFGIVFDGHPGLTRILMPDDWVGHPQRKDYPLGGIPVEYKGAEIPPPDQRRAYQ
jgi:NADH-quinone oxidoreductase subunit C